MQSQPTISYHEAHPPSPDSTNAGFTQSAMPYNNNTQPLRVNHGQTPAPIEPGLGRRNDMYRGDMFPGYEYNPMVGSWEPPAPQPLGPSGYMMPNYDNVGQGRAGTDYGPRYDFTANQFPDPTVLFPYILSGGYTAPNNQGAFLIWRLHNVWVSYAMQDELHVTIAFRRVRSA